MAIVPYRGRIAPSPTGYLHLGHARTFWIAQQRARQHQGHLILRNEDLDSARCKKEFVGAMFEDLRWFGLKWQEGPDCGGPFASYSQSEHRKVYVAALNQLCEGGFIYPCACSRQDVLRSLQAPHQGEEEPVYPGTCRGNLNLRRANDEPGPPLCDLASGDRFSKFNWRFRVPDGETVSFVDAHLGPQEFVAGRDFGDFIIWRHDDVPAYQLACVADDAQMQITEVVRGADLLVSTARQILLYRALRLLAPIFFHCELMTDENGIRLAKRHDALSLRALRAQGADPIMLQSGWKF